MTWCLNHRGRHPAMDHPLVTPGRPGEAQVVAHQDDDAATRPRSFPWLGLHPEGLPSPAPGPLGGCRYTFPAEMMLLAEHDVRLSPREVLLKWLPSCGVGCLDDQGEVLLARCAVDESVQTFVPSVRSPRSLKAIAAWHAVSKGGLLAKRTAQGVRWPRMVGLPVSDRVITRESVPRMAPPSWPISEASAPAGSSAPVVRHVVALPLLHPRRGPLITRGRRAGPSAADQLLALASPPPKVSPPVDADALLRARHAGA